MKRLLIVDDEPDITSVLKKGLEQNGFAVDVFNDPNQALSHYKPDYYDLLILDIKMPKISGFDLYREIKKRDSNVKISFLTAFEMYYEEFKKVFPTTDVKYFITKPIGIADLVKKVNAILDS